MRAGPGDTTGLTYLNNRYHDPALAAFITVDPLVGKTGHPYLYGNGSPVTLSDPTGLFAFECGPSMAGCTDGDFSKAMGRAMEQAFLKVAGEEAMRVRDSVDTYVWSSGTATDSPTESGSKPAS